MFALKSIDTLKILPVYGIDDAVFEAEHGRERKTRFDFEACENLAGIDLAARNLAITMFPCLFVENTIRLEHSPQLTVANRLQPFFHFLNVFENDAHGSIVPEVDSSLQTLERLV